MQFPWENMCSKQGISQLYLSESHLLVYMLIYHDSVLDMHVVGPQMKN